MMLGKKRGDGIAEEIKRWIGSRKLEPGDKLPKEADLLKLFSVSKATAREALKSLEVQGLVTISTGPSGGATIAEVPLDRTLQLMQNYLFFRNVTADDIYALRRITEPELAAGAVPYLTAKDFAALEHSIEICSPVSRLVEVALEQRQEDLRFHDILARANPNPFLRFISEMINEMIRQLIVVDGSPTRRQYQRFGQANVEAHRAIVAAACKRNARKVRTLMLKHIIEAEGYVRNLNGAVRNKLVLDSETGLRISPRRAD